MSVAPVARVTSVTLTPTTETRRINTDACVSAHVKDSTGGAVAGVRVDFAVTAANARMARRTAMPAAKRPSATRVPTLVRTSSLAPSDRSPMAQKSSGYRFGRYSVVCWVAAMIEGSSGDDALTGTEGEDVIAGLGGADTIDGLGGNDVICGGSGDDEIDAGAGGDVVFGEAGVDTRVGWQRGRHAQRRCGQRHARRRRRRRSRPRWQRVGRAVRWRGRRPAAGRRAARCPARRRWPGPGGLPAGGAGDGVDR